MAAAGVWHEGSKPRPGSGVTCKKDLALLARKLKGNMKVLIFDTLAAALDRGAAILPNIVQQKPACVLGLATGSTMLPLYDRLITRHGAEGF